MRTASALVLLLFCAVAANAEPAPGTIMKVTPSQDSANALRLCRARLEMEVASIGKLGTALSLAPSQKPLFDAWRQVYLEQLHTMPCPPPPTGLDTPAPQRTENEAKLAEATRNALQAELPALRALYQALTPEQRAIFDGPRKVIVPPPAASGSRPAPAPHP